MLGNGKLSRHHDQLFGDFLADDVPSMAAGTDSSSREGGTRPHSRQAFKIDALLALGLGSLVGLDGDQFRLGSQRLCSGFGFVESILEKLKLILVCLLAGPAKALRCEQAQLSFHILQFLQDFGQFSFSLKCAFLSYESSFLPGVFDWIDGFSCVFHTHLLRPGDQRVLLDAE